MTQIATAIFTKPLDIPQTPISGGWGDEFEDNEPVSEEDKKAENTEQPQKEEKEEIIPSDSVEPLSRKEVCIVGEWKDEVMKTVTEKIQE